MRKLMLGIALLAASCTSETTANNEVVEISATGKELYEKRCIECHGDDGKLNASGAKDLSVSTFTYAQIKQLLENGSGGMPPFKTVLNEVEMDSLAVYATSLRK